MEEIIRDFGPLFTSLNNAESELEKRETAKKCIEGFAQSDTKRTIDPSNINTSTQPRPSTVSAIMSTKRSTTLDAMKNVKFVKNGKSCVIIYPNSRIKMGLISKDYQNYFDSLFSKYPVTTSRFEEIEVGELTGLDIYITYSTDNKFKKNNISSNLVGKVIKGPLLIWSLKADINVQHIESILTTNQ